MGRRGENRFPHVTTFDDDEEEKRRKRRERERERERDSSGGFETFEVSIFLHRRGFAIRLHSTSPLK